MTSFSDVVALAMQATLGIKDDHSLQESEEKFSSLSLAFKTDRQTLEKRIELNIRARDVAEANIQSELEGLRAGLKLLGHLCSTQSTQEAFTSIQRHVDVLEQSIARMSSRAEVHGAVQQELRVSHVIDAMLNHVENLKKTYEKEHDELEAVRRLEELRVDSEADEISTRTSALRGEHRRLSLAIPARRPSASPPIRNSLTPLHPISEKDVRCVNRTRTSTGVIQPSTAAAEVNTSVASKRGVLRFKSMIDDGRSFFSNISITTGGATLSTSSSKTSSSSTQQSIGASLPAVSSPGAITSEPCPIPSPIGEQNGETMEGINSEKRVGENGVSHEEMKEKTETEEERWEREMHIRELMKKRREALKRSFSRRISLHVTAPTETRMDRIKESMDSAFSWAHERLGGDMLPGLLLFALVFIAIVCLMLAIRFSRFGAFVLFLFSIGR